MTCCILPGNGLAPEAVRMNETAFDRLALDVWQKLLPIIPLELQEHFHKIQILIENQASREQMADLDYPPGTDPLEICGLHVGVPITRESVLDPSPFPASVFLFREALLEQAEYDGSEESLVVLREEIAITLLHEIGHFFGLEEDDLDRLGFG